MTENKVIFLDIDGVLNSAAYDRIRSRDEGNIDISRMPLLKKIILETNAAIVLSSSWRKHWEPDPEQCDQIGCELNRTFNLFDLKIRDKTPVLGNRSAEISAWLNEHPDVTNYVVIDDAFGGWDVHESHLVKTNFRIGRGLEEHHVPTAIELLNRSD